MAQVDYDALAQQARSGAKPPPDTIDYDALAQQARQPKAPPAGIQQPQTPQEIIQEQTGIHPYQNRVAQAAAGPVRAAWGIIRSPYDLAKAAFATPDSPEEAAALAGGGHLGLALDRMLVYPAMAAHSTASQLRNQAIDTRDLAKKIESAADDPKKLESLAKGYPQMDLSSPDKAKQQAHELTKQAIKLYVESVPADMGAIPIIGPQGQQAGARMAAGDVPGAITESATNAFLMGAAETVSEAGKATVAKTGEVATRAARSMTDQLAGIHERTAAKVVDKAVAKNAEAKAAAEQKTAEAREKFEQAIAETEEYNAKIHAKAEDAHDEALTKVRRENDRIREKHQKLVERREEENNAAEHQLELRRQREQELQQETEAYYAREDEVKAKAKAEENAAWQPWHEKMKDVSIDGGQIAKPLEQIAAVSPDVARTLRQLIPDPGEAAPDSQYALDRAAIMKSQGIDPGKTSYWELPEAKRVAIDRIAASSGYEPEPIDFDPKVGHAMPVETIHRAQSILGRYIRSGRYEGHVLGEMKQVQKVLRAALTRASQEHGALGDLEAARATTQRYQEAFGREHHAPRTQDEIREKEANPEAYKEREDQERLEAARKHDEGLVAAYERVKAKREELRKMPSEEQMRRRIRQSPPPPSFGDLRSGYRLRPEPAYRPPTEGDLRQGYSLRSVPKPLTDEELETGAFEHLQQPLRTPAPKEPKPVEPEIKQVGEQELTEANQEELQARVDYLRRRGIFILGSGLTVTAFAVMRSLLQMHMGPAIEEAIGGAIVSPLTVVGLNKVAEILERPAVRDWLTKPTVQQMRQLDRLPPEQRTAVADGLKKMRIVARKHGYTFNPLLVRYINVNSKQEQQ